MCAGDRPTSGPPSSSGVADACAAVAGGVDVRTQPASQLSIEFVTAVARDGEVTTPPSAGGGLVKAFPLGFRWGTATAAHRIEGGTIDGGHGPKVCGTFYQSYGNSANEDTRDVATDLYHQRTAAHDTFSDIGRCLHRFSSSWPRLFDADQATGGARTAGIAIHKTLIDGLPGPPHHPTWHALPLGPAIGARTWGDWGADPPHQRLSPPCAGVL